jgi:hypothetical protein
MGALLTIVASPCDLLYCTVAGVVNVPNEVDTFFHGQTPTPPGDCVSVCDGVGVGLIIVACVGILCCITLCAVAVKFWGHIFCGCCIKKKHPQPTYVLIGQSYPEMATVESRYYNQPSTQPITHHDFFEWLTLSNQKQF